MNLYQNQELWLELYTSLKQKYPQLELAFAPEVLFAPTGEQINWPVWQKLRQDFYQQLRQINVNWQDFFAEHSQAKWQTAFALLTLWRQALPFLRPQVNQNLRILQNNPPYCLTRSLVVALTLLPQLEQIIQQGQGDARLCQLLGQVDFRFPYYPEQEKRELMWLLDKAEPQNYAQLLDAYFLEAKPLGKVEQSTVFYNSEFYSQGVLTPRPGTEAVVEQIVEATTSFIQANWQEISSRPRPFNIVDLGSGSGCLGISILQELVLKFAKTNLNFSLISVDIDEQALAVSQHNQDKCLKLDPLNWDKIDPFACALSKNPALGQKFRAQVQKSNWLEAIDAPVDLLVSNPPYIDADDPLLVYSQDDPWLALVADKQGLQAYETILDQAPRVLAPRALVGVEYGYQQEQAVTQLAQKNQQYHLLKSFVDYGEQPRGTIWLWQEDK